MSTERDELAAIIDDRWHGYGYNPQGAADAILAAGFTKKKCCAGCPDCQGIPGPRPCIEVAETGGRCVLDVGHGGLHK